MGFLSFFTAGNPFGISMKEFVRASMTPKGSELSHREAQAIVPQQQVQTTFSFTSTCMDGARR